MACLRSGRTPMTPNPPTKSESLFAELCSQHEVTCNKLPELYRRKQPDFEIVLGNQRVVVEVKQIEPNEADLAHAEARRQEKIVVQSRDPDAVAAGCESRSVRAGLSSIPTLSKTQIHSRYLSSLTTPTISTPTHTPSKPRFTVGNRLSSA